MMRPILALIILLAVVVPAAAHDPYIEEADWGGFDDPYTVEDAAVSYALYGYLKDEDDVDVFRLDFSEADMLLRVELLVPVCGDHYVNYHPRFVVLGPEGAPPNLPFEVPDDLRVVYPTPSAEATPEATPDARGIFVEPFGGTEYYESPRVDIRVPAPGAYYVAVYDPAGAGGDYTLATGYREEFRSPVGQVMRNVATIRTGGWLHRRCDLPPGHPDAVIVHDHGHE